MPGGLPKGHPCRAQYSHSHAITLGIPTPVSPQALYHRLQETTVEKKPAAQRPFHVNTRWRGYNSRDRMFRLNRATRRVASPHVVSIADFCSLAQSRLPRAVFDYLDGGAEGEVTLRENCRAFQDVTFRPRHAVALPICEQRTRAPAF